MGEAEWTRWRAARLARLRSEHGWLSIAGRWELGEGPLDLPIGRFTLEGGGVRFVASAPVARLDGTPVAEAVLVPDQDALIDGPRRWELANVGGEVIIRVRDPDNPRRHALVDLPCWPYEPRWALAGRLVPDEQPGGLTYASGMRVERVSPGRIAIEIAGVESSLECTAEGPGRLFVAVADLTNADESYPAGRFVTATLVGDVVSVDLNLAYNPPCALTDFATCPVVPASNRLDVRVEAGEKLAIFRENSP